jgi:hypothetical protein
MKLAVHRKFCRASETGCRTVTAHVTSPGSYGKGYPRGKKTAPNGRNAVLGVARPQGVEGLGMAGRGETLGSPWILLPVGAWTSHMTLIRVVT